ncbi:hypothetical protein LAZ67_22001998 [Cordylochernes scorpioides]|uniref:Reverse transcriptase domain-containing protein n=1 Tax=Cordylochernes scorpioides TaxID=51811 RepID=A0ABY6LU54_9ARAC|nr:hypothetical protein LAZ67_22001998 [Cordylochernes scorpioides]
MLEYDIIEPSFSPYSSPVTLVTKRDKTKRFCVDYRRLNEIIFPDVHPLPLIENILDKLANAKIYSRADFSSAYWSIEISPPDRNLLSFVTLEGQYNFKRLPYGIKIGPQVYERAVSQILQRNRLGFIAHYFDDFIIFSNSIEEHLDHLQQFFDMCNRENFRLNYIKCDFFKTTIEFLGYTISSGTYTPLVKNLDVINAIKVPTSVKSLQSFLGSINVYNKFIKDHARIRNPLNNLLKKDTPWHWNAKCQHSFDTLKECLTTKPVLHLFKEGLPCQLFCDASLQGIAGILKQQHPDGTLHPVQYYSRTLRPHEKNYTITELECLAVIDSVEKFRIYLAGVSVCTDGAPAMKGSRKGLIPHVIKNPNIKFVHCMIHREMLVSKSVPPILVTTLDEVVKVVNYIKSNALRSRIFSTFCEAMDSDYKKLLFHTEVRWLSKGKVLNRFISMKNEIMAFIDNEEINFPFMMSDVWWLRVSFLGDIFDKLNSLNLNLQGAQENIITISTKLKAFKEKLSLWNLNIAKKNFASFPMVKENPSKSIIKKEVEETLTLLSASFDKYFPYLDVEKMEYVVNPFMHCEIQHLEEEIWDCPGVELSPTHIFSCPAMAAALQKIDMDPEQKLYTPKILDIATSVIEMYGGI